MSYWESRGEARGYRCVDRETYLEEYAHRIGPEVIEIINRKRPDLHATWEYPGCVVVAGYWFGTANNTWDGSPEDGSSDDLGRVTEVPSGCIESDKIADAIIVAVSQH
jgi:hypothetical protein